MSQDSHLVPHSLYYSHSLHSIHTSHSFIPDIPYIPAMLHIPSIPDIPSFPTLLTFLHSRHFLNSRHASHSLHSRHASHSQHSSHSSHCHPDPPGDKKPRRSKFTDHADEWFDREKLSKSRTFTDSPVVVDRSKECSNVSDSIETLSRSLFHEDLMSYQKYFEFQ